MEPIAIVGMGCRFPGANGLSDFWRLLSEGVDAISEVPPDRWDLDTFYSDLPQAPGKLATRFGGFLGGADRFDPGFFWISPREAERMDPQQRLLMEVTWEALEDAGLQRESLSGSQTGVFVGMASSDFSRAELGDFRDLDMHSTTGVAQSIAANRLSYFLDLHGPSMVIDTACSSSLVAIQQACRSLQSGESSLALAGGVNMLLSPAITIGFSRLGAMAPDGRCKAFDARANGFVRSEGVGMVVLKPLKEAMKDGDRIYAVVRGGAVNQDGRTNGLTAPSRWAQEAVLKAAYRDAGIAPSQVQYVEAHGTGTKLGDPIETTALGQVLGPGRNEGAVCRLGSVKTNIGHTEAAAGVAGVIKVALAMHHGALPPSLHFETPNPYIPFDKLPLRVQTALEPWPSAGEPYLAGVSSFGFGGTNAHLVLESAPAPAPLSSLAESASYLLPISAHMPAALQQLVASYRDRYEAERPALADFVSAVARRTHHDQRLAVAFRSGADLSRLLSAFLRGEPTEHLVSGEAGDRSKIAFVFSGQGCHWLGMGRQLVAEEPVFREAVVACDRAMRPFAPWSVFDLLSQDHAADWQDDIGRVVPAIFAVQVGLAALWQSWGIVPAAVTGHSMGEIAAAYVAGALTLDEAARIICLRSRLLERIRGKGAMAQVELSAEQAAEAIGACGDRVSVAASNGARTTVLAGEPETLSRVLGGLDPQIFWRHVKVDAAFHSPQVDPLASELAAGLAGLRPQAGRIPFYSTVTGGREAGTTLDERYWARNLREPVQFFAAQTALMDDGFDTFIEIGPHPVLLAAMRENMQAIHGGLAVASLSRDKDDALTLRSQLGTLYAHGYPVDWGRLYARGRRMEWPAYPWQHESFGWKREAALRGGSGARIGGDDLLGSPLRPALLPGTCLWECERSRKALQIHPDRPEEACETLATMAARQELGESAQLIAREILAPLPASVCRFQIVLQPVDERSWRVQVFARPADLTDAEWACCYVGSFERRAALPSDGLWYRCAWRSAPALREGPRAPGGWLLVASGELATPLAARLEASGAPCTTTMLDPAIPMRQWKEQFRGLAQRAIAESERALSGIVVLWPEGREQQAQTAAHVTALVQALAAMGWRDWPRLWFVTDTAVATLPALALAQVVMHEHADLRCSVIELANQDTDAELSALCAELHVNGPETRIALKGETRWVARLEQVESPLADQAMPDISGTYLLAGAASPFNLELARWLRRRGASHVIVLDPAGGSVTPDGVTVLALDPARGEALEDSLARALAPLAPVSGLVLAPRFPAEQTLLHLEAEAIAMELESQARAAWNLHEWATRHALERFMVLSSWAPVLGAPGMAAAAVSHGMLDALVERRLAAGQPVLGINWAQSLEAESGSDRMGLQALEPAACFRIVEGLMETGSRRVAALAFNLRQWRQSYPRVSEDPLFLELPLTAAVAAADASPLAVELRELSRAKRRERLEMYLVAQLTEIMKVGAARVGTKTRFADLGLNSLMAVELRNRLEQALGLTLSATLAWSYPSTEALSGYLAERLENEGEVSVLEVTIPQAIAPEAHQAIESLSVDEAEALLLKKLAALQERGI